MRGIWALLAAVMVLPVSAFGATTSNALAGGIVINEVLLDPNGALNFDTDGNGLFETGDEFIELYNASAGTIDISGWQVWEGGGAGNLIHTFPGTPGSATTTLGAGEFVIIIGVVGAGGSLPTPVPGGIAVNAASSGGMGLANGGDTIAVLDTNTNQYIQLDIPAATVNVPGTTFTNDGGFSATATLVGSVEVWNQETDGSSTGRVPDGDTSFTIYNTGSGGTINGTPGTTSAGVPVELSEFSAE